MRLPEILKAAEEHGVDRMWAVARRRDCLAGRHFDLRLQMQEDAEFLEESGRSELETLIWAESIVRAAYELREIALEQRRLKEWFDRVNDKQAITDDDIAMARAYPIDKLIDFGRGGKVTCPFHEDRNPSAYHGTRANRLVCPVCNETWSAIDVLIKRDGMNFVDAVKHLNGR